MKAIVKTKTGPGVDILDVAKPEIREADILVKVQAASLCGSDLHIYEGTPGYEYLPLPVILGHEFAGEVVEIGSRVQGLAIGNRITANPTMPCGECDWCKVGKGARCRSGFSLGLTGNGAFAEYVVIKAGGDVFKIPDNVSLECASLCEPLSIVLNGLDLSQFQAGQPVVVLGPGPIGLLMVQVLKAAGAGPIILTGTTADARRLDIARQLGADIIVNVQEEDPVKAVVRHAGRVNYVFEATGISATIAQGLAMLNPGGKLMVIGIHAENAVFNPLDLVRKRKSIIGVYGYNQNTWKRSLSLLSTGAINPEPMITHRIPFSKGEEGFRLAHDKIAAKVIFVPEEQ
ncbi:MAG: zinc-binding dehydrogenase [Desulfobacteraceae bacterium]|nr:zinc-binding dehydrogenase [Desulfobacteraceae bacterium]